MKTFVQIIVEQKGSENPIDCTEVYLKIEEMCKNNGWRYSGSITERSDEEVGRFLTVGREIRTSKK